MSQKKKIIVANWKMNPTKAEEAKRIFSRIKRSVAGVQGVTVVVCPSDVHLMALARLSTTGSVRVGVQDVFWEDQGLFTGQVSPAQAWNAGARYAIVGHSEKRKLGETNAQAAKKLLAVVHDGMTGILCVGEDRRDKDGNFFALLKDQILASLIHISRAILARSVMLAYEPVWEIGRSDLQAMKPRDVHETAIFIRKVINDAFGPDVARSLPILYGGSVSTENAHATVYEGGVDGLLVGRQSLDTETFSVIIKSMHSGYARK